jgi:hypothetical protein
MAKKFDARAARTLTEKATVNVDEYLDLIEIEAKEGKSETTISLREIGNTEQSPELVVKALKALGFKAEVTTDQRDGDYYHIKW